MTLLRRLLVQERQECQTLGMLGLNADVLQWVRRGLKILSMFVDREKMTTEGRVKT